METFAARLTEARRRRKLSQAQLARACGWESQSRISQYEQDKREPRAADLELLARALDVSASWLQFGEQTATSGRMVPLLSWVAAGSWQQTTEIAEPAGADQWVEARARVSPDAFALTVRGDSMSPDFPSGSVIICDPARAHRSGSLVVARLDAEREATFKEFVQDGGKAYLKPLNPQYPVLPLDGGATVCGVVVEMYFHRVL